MGVRRNSSRGGKRQHFAYHLKRFTLSTSQRTRPFGGKHLISLSDNNNIRSAHWVDHQWNADWADDPTRLRTFISDTGTHPSERPSQEQPGSSLIAYAPLSDVSAPACTNGVWPPLRPVSVAQKNKPSTILSSNVQSIGLLMDCMAWRFRTMRKSNGCSTSAPRSSAA